MDESGVAYEVQIMSLSESEKEKYARNILLDEIGTAGQEKLKASSVLIVGAGGLGSPAALYLAAAGVGRIGVADPDTVSLSNLQRQILHGMADLGRLKVDSAYDALKAVEPAAKIETYPVCLDQHNISEIISGYDFILDCSDNYQTRFLVNDACVGAGKPFCHAGVFRFRGQVMTYVPGEGPCYRCVFGCPPKKKPDSPGVMGAVCGIIGSIQAMEAIKYITGSGKLLTGRMLTVDALTMEFLEIELPEAKHELGSRPGDGCTGYC